jgi:protein O-GlcNAc transferase
MGLFDRLPGAANKRPVTTETDEQHAARLLEEGMALEQQAQTDEALQRYDGAILLMPELARAHFNRGNILLERGEAESALAAYTKAVKYKPDSAAAHYNLGNACVALSRHEAAATSYRQAIALKPDFVDAHVALGGALEELGQLEPAIESYHQGVAIRPDYAEAQYNLGRALSVLGRLDEAAASFYRALGLNPDYADARDSLLFMHSYRGDQAAEVMLSEARLYGEMVARQARPYTAWKNSPDASRCLRVGVVSGDLRNHPIGYFAENVMAALASGYADRVTLFAYLTRDCTDKITERIKASCRGWCPVVGFSDAQLAERIRADNIDILIDLSGHSADNRLPVFAWKPAPVQVSWLGYFATTGVAAVDYFVGDPWTLPASEERNFTEKIWRLPETWLCFTPPDVAVAVSPLPALRNRHVTFGCFNNLSKMSESVVALWARVMKAMPGSCLFLKAGQLMETSVQQSIAGRFAAHGIDANRLILEAYVPRAEYLAAYQRVDIALDPFPYPGGTTTVEALWMGVPVLTLAGERFLSRQGVGLLMNAGLPDWVASDLDDYVARALAHAGDLPRLAALRGNLRAQVLASPIYDAPRFAKHFETALRGMWQHWCDQQA